MMPAASNSRFDPSAPQFSYKRNIKGDDIKVSLKCTGKVIGNGDDYLVAEYAFLTNA